MVASAGMAAWKFYLLANAFSVLSQLTWVYVEDMVQIRNKCLNEFAVSLHLLFTEGGS